VPKPLVGNALYCWPGFASCLQTMSTDPETSADAYSAAFEETFVRLRGAPYLLTPLLAAYEIARAGSPPRKSRRIRTHSPIRLKSRTEASVP